MNLSTLLGAIITMTLTACAANTSSTTQTTTPTHHTASHLPDEQFECRNGATLIVRHNAGDGKINLSVDTIGNTATLTQAVAASGTRYAASNGFYGKPTEFHYNSRGMGAFSFQDAYGNSVETVCNKK